MDPTLSVIMPCYNCSSTLEEAVNSIFIQNLKTSFEVVLVDDGSTDNTREVIKNLSTTYPEIRVFYHDTNKGGGAARNTAVTKSRSNIIFCLDSDDIIEPNTLQRMIDFMIERKCDGVIFENKKFFINNIKNIKGGGKNIITDKKIQFSDLFTGIQGPLTLENFIYTKTAFLKTGGYPTNHGFDTQGFGFRFLAKNQHVCICPNSIYYQRIGSKKAYFASVYEKGELSINTFLILSDVIYLFSKKTCRFIMEYDIFNNTKLGNKNLSSALHKLYIADPEHFFIEKKESYMREDGFAKFYDEYKDSHDPEDIFCLGIYSYTQGEYARSYQYFNALTQIEPHARVIAYVILRSSLAIKKENVGTNFDALTLKHFVLTQQKIYLNPNFIIKSLVRLKVRIRNLMQKNS